MAITNSERIKRALDLLRSGLIPFVERRLKATWGTHWRSRLRQAEETVGTGDAPIAWDSHLLLKALCFQGEFRAELGPDVLSAAHALRTVRNQYAHERPFNSLNTLQALGNARTLLETASAKTQLASIVNLHEELMRTIVAEQNRTRHNNPSRNRQDIVSDHNVRGTPWRSIVTPHADVLSDSYTEAEFAADLGQVVRGEARPEYGHPEEFFKRTFLTTGLRALLTSVAQRLTGKGGDPVMELQTGFGGGKTHSMLALYHMCGAGPKAKELQGIDDLLRELELTNLPQARRAVFVGTMRGVSDVETQDCGTQIHTMWGSLAWQLGGRKGYDLVAVADREGTAPGSEALSRLLRLSSPCLILIDEWVAFIRQLYRMSEPPSAGSFEANLTFVQSLTEAARAVPGAVVAASLPASKIEIGGEGGTEALKHLESVFGRMESPWRAATADESFEIVRGRLFEPVTDSQKLRARDRTIDAFWNAYREARREFPPECTEPAYKERMRKAYPIHPVLFDHLYQDWGSLDRFQRTRGVLRMIATIVRVNWERGNDHRLVLPSSIPLDDGTVQAEVVKSLDRDWSAVLEKDVDGANSLPWKIDNEIPNLGRYNATRRVTRCLFIGTAPTFETSEHPGIDERQIRLGSTQPGEVHQSYGDALRRLAVQATYLYQDGSRMWLATKPSVAKLAEDRAAACSSRDVEARIVKQLRDLCGQGDFDRVHVAPSGSADVPDIDTARLVVLKPGDTFAASEERSAAHKTCRDILLHRSPAQRCYRNMIVFLAADGTGIGAVENAAKASLAWESIVNDRENLALDAQQGALAQKRKQETAEILQNRISETWNRVMIPEADASGQVSWNSFHLGGTGRLAERVSSRLVRDEQLYTKLGPLRLQMILDEYNLWHGQSHVQIQRVWENLCSYLYLPRMCDRGILHEAVKSAVSQLHNDTFAFAKDIDGEGRYEGLVLEGETDPWLALDAQHALLVQLEKARSQLDKESDLQGKEDTDNSTDTDENNGKKGRDPSDPPPKKYQRFWGAVDVDPERLGADAGRIAEEVLSFLTPVSGAKVKVTLEISAELPNGIEDGTVRTVKENGSTLNFNDCQFETE